MTVRKALPSCLEQTLNRSTFSLQACSERCHRDATQRLFANPVSCGLHSFTLPQLGLHSLKKPRGQLFCWVKDICGMLAVQNICGGLLCVNWLAVRDALESRSVHFYAWALELRCSHLSTWGFKLPELYELDISQKQKKNKCMRSVISFKPSQGCAA